MPRMSGFELLDIVQKQFKIPVIMISADNSIQAMTKAARLGACSYIVKPVNKSSIQNVGQFVIREQPVNYRRFLEINGSMRKENAEDGNRDGDGKNEDDMIPTKNSRMAWTPYLHKKFVAAVQFLSDKSGDKNATPTKILEVMTIKMNIKGLTRRNIASHLQKYRLHLKEIRNPCIGSTQVGDSSNPFMNANPVPVPTMFRVTPGAPSVVDHHCQNLEQELNQHGPNNYAELCNYGSTQVGDSSNLFMNSNAIPNMLQPNYQNLGQELYQHGLNSFVEPQLWDNEGVIA